MSDRERLIDLILQSELEAEKHCIFNCHRSRYKAEIVADFLISNRVIVLPMPVKIGDAVYEIRRKAVSPSGRKTNCGICTNSFLKHCIKQGDELYVKEKPYVKSDITRLGKTVFLTREEAEMILEDMKK